MPKPSHLLPMYTFEQVAEAVDRPVQTLRGWHTAKVPVLKPRDQRGHQGVPNLLSLASAARVAIAMQLQIAGMRRERALRAAESFSDTNAHDHDDKNQRISERIPGTLFPSQLGVTWLVVSSILKKPVARLVRAKALPDNEFYVVKSGRIADPLLITVNCNILMIGLAARLGAKEVYS